MDVFKNAKWIWTVAPGVRNNYAEFVANFNVENNKNVKLRVACDSIYAAYINGEVVGFSRCADFPHYKVYDEIDISKYCKEENTLSLIVWYTGVDTQTYNKDTAGAILK